MKNNRSILWKWIISYLCLLLVPLLSIFINYNNNERNLNTEYINTFMQSFNNLNTAVDSYVTNMTNYQTYILKNDCYQFLMKKKELNNFFYYNAFEFKTELSIYNDVNTPLHCAVYFDNQDYIISPDTGTNSLSYYTNMKYMVPSTPEYNEWLSFISSRYTNDYLVFTGLNTTDSPCLILAHTITLRNNTYNTIFISTPLSELTHILKVLPDHTYFVIQSTDNRLYFLDKDGQFSSNEPGLAKSWLTAADLNTVSLGADNRLILPDNYISISSPSQTSGFTCHLVISEEVMDERLYGVQMNFVLTLTVTLLLGLAGIAVLIFINYRPVSNLLKEFNVNPAGNNEFSKILATYKSLKKDYSLARRAVSQQNQNVLNNWLLSLLKGRISELDILKKNMIPEMDSYSKVALVGFKLPLSDQQNIEYDDLLFFIVDNIFRELFKEYTFYHIEDGRFIYYLFDLTDRYTDEINRPGEPLSITWHDFALEKIDYLCNLVNTKNDCPVVGIISEPATSLISSKFLYRKVMESFELQGMWGGNTAIDTNSANIQEPPEHIREVIEQELDLAVKEGNLKAALKVSSQIFYAEHEIAFSTQKAYAFDAFTLVLGIFNNYISNPIQRTNALNYITPLMQASTTKELKNCFDEILVFICGEIAKKWQLESREIILRIRKYIEENYTDQNLSVSSMADALERNPKYISRVFKEDTGEGILDYITHYRISKSRELMHLNQYTLKEISGMVGYSNVQTFRKAFIKLVGDIPSKYNK